MTKYRFTHKSKINTLKFFILSLRLKVELVFLYKRVIAGTSCPETKHKGPDSTVDRVVMGEANVLGLDQFQCQELPAYSEPAMSLA